MNLQDEYTQLEMEEKRLRVAELKRKHAEHEEKVTAQKRRAKQIADDEKITKARNDHKQSVCQHRKGGKGFEGFLNGNASDYAVIKHINALGDMLVICQRCGKEWKPGVPGYAEATRFPTDNETSSSITFTIPHAKTTDPAAAS